MKTESGEEQEVNLTFAAALDVLHTGLEVIEL